MNRLAGGRYALPVTRVCSSTPYVDGFISRDGTHMGNQFRPAFDGLGEFTKHRFAFIGRLQKSLAGAATHIKAVQALGQFKLGQRTKPIQIEFSVRCERCDQR